MHATRNAARGLVCGLVVVTALLFDLASAQTVWTKDPGNPVLAPGPPGAWDYPEVHGHAVVFDEADKAASSDGTYKMWYNGGRFDPFHVGYATSADGIRWVKNDQPVLSPGPPGTWDDETVFVSTSVVLDDRPGQNRARFKLWYGGWDGSQEQIGLATSTDGIRWAKYPRNPVFDPMGDSDSPLREPAVIFIESRDLFYMFYVGGTMNSEARIDLATSPNGVDWTSPRTVLSGRPGLWDSAVWTPGVLFDEDAKLFHMWYGGGEFVEELSRIGYATSPDLNDWWDAGATSPDLINWQGRNMVLRAGVAEAWDSGGIGPHHPAVRFDPKRNIYEMWYFGAQDDPRNQLPDGLNQSIGYATSPLDGAESLFRRGDTSGDGMVNITDSVALLEHLFGSGAEPGCEDAADANDDGELGLTDAIYGLAHLFQGGPPPPAPGPTVCGVDPTDEEPDLGCVVPPQC